MAKQNMDKRSGWRGSEELWLDAAYEVLIESGVESVKVMPLAKSLGLSRTSFYGHFDSREELLEKLIQRWREKNTGNLIHQTEAFATNIAEALFNLFDCWLDFDLFDDKLDFAIRNWALSDTRLKAVLETVDQERVAAIRTMFERFGFDALQASVRAHTVYYTQIGYISMMVSEPDEMRIPLMPLYVETFCGLKPSEAEIARFAGRHQIDLTLVLSRIRHASA